MKSGVWIAKKNELCAEIKMLSDMFGGDDIDWLREYCKDVISSHKSDLDTAIKCFKEIYRWKK